MAVYYLLIFKYFCSIYTVLTVRLNSRIAIQNVVINGFFSEKIDLNRAHAVLENSKYDHERFPGLVYRLDDPPATALLFRNGTFICTGVKSEKVGRRAVDKLLQVLQEKGLVSPDCMYEFQVRNIVASVTIENAAIDIKQLLKEFDGANYEPERFPAAIYHMKDPDVSFLVFSNGRLICSGAKDEDILVEAVDKLCRTLQEKGVMRMTA